MDMHLRDKSDQESHDNHAHQHRYLIFNVGGELFGTRLLHIREIVEPTPTKPIPSTVSHFLGVINLRGKIIGIIDLRLRFGAEPLITEKLAYIIFDTDKGPLGAVVDSVESVITLDERHIERDPAIATRIPTNFLLGIGRSEENLISIIDLKGVLSDEELIKIADVRHGTKKSVSA